MMTTHDIDYLAACIKHLTLVFACSAAAVILTILAVVPGKKKGK